MPLQHELLDVIKAHVETGATKDKIVRALEWAFISLVASLPADRRKEVVRDWAARADLQLAVANALAADRGEPPSSETRGRVGGKNALRSGGGR